MRRFRIESIEPGRNPDRGDLVAGPRKHHLFDVVRLHSCGCICPPPPQKKEDIKSTPLPHPPPPNPFTLLILASQPEHSPLSLKGTVCHKRTSIKQCYWEKKERNKEETRNLSRQFFPFTLSLLPLPPPPSRAKASNHTRILVFFVISFHLSPL